VFIRVLQYRVCVAGITKFHHYNVSCPKPLEIRPRIMKRRAVLNLIIKY